VSINGSRTSFPKQTKSPYKTQATGSPEITMCLKTQSYDPDNNTCVDN